MSYGEKKRKTLECAANFAQFTQRITAIGGLISESERHKIDDILQQAEKIENGTFTLMVAGEAKSGKSTFINAYLDCEILPMDVNECTSAIIKIHHGERCLLRAVRAGGDVLVIDGEQAVKDFLARHAALDQESRDIPVSLIDQELLIKCKGSPAQAQINRLIEDSCVNDMKLPPEEFARKRDEFSARVNRYIMRNRDRWEEIICDIDVEWPLQESLREITIVDSPGVNTRGILGKITAKYIETANAVIFTKTIHSAAASASFLKFMESKSLDAHKETLFLVLTRSADMKTTEQNAARAEALRVFEKSINQDHLLVVDSKTQLVLNHCMKMETVEQIDAYLEENTTDNNNFFSGISYKWLKCHQNREAFRTEMLRQSNFGEIKESLERFARGAQELALRVLLDDMLAMCRLYAKKAEDFAKLFEAGNLNDMLSSVHMKEQELEKIRYSINVALDQIRSSFCDPVWEDKAHVPHDGIIEEERRKKVEKYRAKFQECRKNGDFIRLSNEMERATQAMKDFRDVIQKQLIQQCNQSLLALTEAESSMDYDFIVPLFSQKELDGIIDSTKGNAYSSRTYETVEGRLCPKKVLHTRSEYDAARHINMVSDLLIGKIETISGNMARDLIDYAAMLLTVYKDKLITRMTQLLTDYTNILLKLTDVYVKEINLMLSLQEEDEAKREFSDLLERTLAIYVSALDKLDEKGRDQRKKALLLEIAEGNFGQAGTVQAALARIGSGHVAPGSMPVLPKDLQEQVTQLTAEMRNKLTGAGGMARNLQDDLGICLEAIVK